MTNFRYNSVCISFYANSVFHIYVFVYESNQFVCVQFPCMKWIPVVFVTYLKLIVNVLFNTYEIHNNNINNDRIKMLRYLLYLFCVLIIDIRYVRGAFYVFSIRGCCSCLTDTASAWTVCIENEFWSPGNGFVSTEHSSSRYSKFTKPNLPQNYNRSLK